jgi:hypothetical protein
LRDSFGGGLPEVGGENGRAAPDTQLVQAWRAGGKFKNQSAKIKEASNSKPQNHPAGWNPVRGAGNGEASLRLFLIVLICFFR